MARKMTRVPVAGTTARLVEAFARRWGEQTARALPPEIKRHARGDALARYLASLK